MNQTFPLTIGDVAEMMFIATQSGAIVRPDNRAPIKRGLVVLDSSAALTMTLAAPLAGPQIAGGEDGCILKFAVVAGVAADASGVVNHVLSGSSPMFQYASGTGPFSSLNLAGIIGSVTTLLAYNGYWWVLTEQNAQVQ